MDIMVKDLTDAVNELTEDELTEFLLAGYKKYAEEGFHGNTDTETEEMG